MGNGKKVLVVDDNNLIRVLVSQVLSEAGYVALTAGDGESGLVIAENIKPDLIITDYAMPGMDGAEFVKSVRAKKTEWAKLVPILGLSGSHRDSDQYLLDAGATACLRKPLLDEPLINAVKRLVKE